MDFFADQDRYRRRSRWMIALFVLAVLAVVAVVDLVVAWGYHLGKAFLSGVDGHMSWSAIATLSGILLVLIALASIWRIATLRGGGAVVAMGMGAAPVPAGTTDPTWRRLRNVVEEIAIASGVPVFNIFVMEHELGINAFAAGYTASDAAICVSQGCLDKLDRDELQGVVAHELGHVVNGDMRLNIRLMGLLYGIIGVGVIGHRMLDAGMNFASRRGSAMDNSMPALLFMGGLAAVCFGAAGSFCGRLVQAAVARTRESLADASAVRFTRQTAGIAGALKKIAALREGSRIRAPGRLEVMHMLFGAPGRPGGWFATHPPLRKRLRALGVHWSDREIAALASAWQHPPRAADPASPAASLAGFAPAAVAGADGGRERPAARPGAAPTTAPGRISSRAGRPQARDFDLAATLRERLPEGLRQAAQDPSRAEALLLALGLGGQAAVLDRQKAIIERTLGAAAVAAAEQARATVAGLDPMLRLPLAALALPTLRRRPRPQLRQLLDTLDALARADARVDLDEYCLLRLLGRQLHDLLDPAAGFRPGTRRLRDCRESFATVCAILARHGNRGDAEAARRAFLLAMQRTLPGWRAEPVVPADWQAALDRALAALDRLRALDKQLVVDGLAIVVDADGIVVAVESELLRMICAVLHCPLPLLRARPARAP